MSAFYIAPTIAQKEGYMNEFTINLQLFAEEDTFSEGFEDTGSPMPEDDMTMETETVEDTKPIESVQEVTEVKTDIPKVKVKYNHEEKEFTHEEAVPLIQKGMNYDKTLEKLQGFEKSTALAYVEKLAKANNMTVDQIVEHWQQADEQAEIQALADKDNVPYEIAERLYKTEQKTNQIESRLNKEQQTKTEKDKEANDFKEFIANYPDVKPNEIPKEVWEYQTKTNKSLSDCMMWHENQTIKNELKLLKQNAENAKKAPVGSVTAHGSMEIQSTDPFEIGFNSVK